jgi:hypothetical protein
MRRILSAMAGVLVTFLPAPGAPAAAPVPAPKASPAAPAQPPDAAPAPIKVKTPGLVAELKFTLKEFQDVTGAGGGGPFPAEGKDAFSFIASLSPNASLTVEVKRFGSVEEAQAALAAAVKAYEPRHVGRFAVAPLGTLATVAGVGDACFSFASPPAPAGTSDFAQKVMVVRNNVTINIMVMSQMTALPRTWEPVALAKRMDPRVLAMRAAAEPPPVALAKPIKVKTPGKVKAVDFDLKEFEDLGKVQLNNGNQRATDGFSFTALTQTESLGVSVRLFSSAEAAQAILEDRLKVWARDNPATPAAPMPADIGDAGILLTTAPRTLRGGTPDTRTVLLVRNNALIEIELRPEDLTRPPRPALPASWDPATLARRLDKRVLGMLTDPPAAVPEPKAAPAAPNP